MAFVIWIRICLFIIFLFILKQLYSFLNNLFKFETLKQFSFTANYKKIAL